MGNVVSAQLYAQIDTQVGKHVFTLVSKLQRGGALLAQTLAHAPTPTAAAAAAAAAPVLAWRATSAGPATTLEQADLRGGLGLGQRRRPRRRLWRGRRWFRVAVVQGGGGSGGRRWFRAAGGAGAGRCSKAGRRRATSCKARSANCCFLGALAVAARNEHLARAVLLATAAAGPLYKQHGLFVCCFYKGGSWRFVVVDDRVPVHASGGGPVFARCRDPEELWAPILEKARPRARLVCGGERRRLGLWSCPTQPVAGVAVSTAGASFAAVSTAGR
jgi:hypothetical protein